MDQSKMCQIIMATLSPLLMAYPHARLLRITRHELHPVTVQETDHFRIMQDFAMIWRG